MTWKGVTPIRSLRSSPTPSTSTAPTELPRGSDVTSSDIGLLTNPRRPIVIGHRGASHSFPENTLLSFQKAIEAGVHALEFDVRSSRDGVPVVIHDPTIDRTTDGSGLVTGFTGRDLQRLDAGRGERIPTLADVLDAFPDVPMLLDVKTSRASKAVIDMLVAHGAKLRVIVGSFEPGALRPFREASVPTTASKRETAVWWAASRIGANPPIWAFSAFSIPEQSGRIRVADRRFLRRAALRGIPVHVWTVDDVETAIRLWSWGVSGIVTNQPSELVGALARTGQGRYG